MTKEDYKKVSGTIPKNPGIYKFMDSKDTILYVGKAKNLRNRVNSYFVNDKQKSFKTRTLVKNADHIEIMIVDTEQDALLLENSLIKNFQPRYNVMLKDGKSYTYICIKKERFPRVFFTRTVTKDGSQYFGPYTSKYRAKVIFDLIKKLFQLRTCHFNLTKENVNAGKFKVCLEYHIKNCKGGCEGLESEEDYNAKIEQVKNIIKGYFKPVKDYVKEEMQNHVKNLEFEKAHDLKEKLSYFEDFQSKSTVVSTTIEDLDVFALKAEEDLAFVTYLKVVNGAIINSDTVEMKLNAESNLSNVLVHAILRLREKFNSIAPEIIVPIDLDIEIQDFKWTIPQRGDKFKLLELAEKNLTYYAFQKKKEAINKIKKVTSSERILTTLKSDLQMDVLPLHIECFDNSNIQGTNPVASCVVFKNAKPAKSEYRKFNIKTVEGPDDFASMTEVVHRRYSRLLKEEKSLPQLVIIDGGKGQLSASMKSIDALGLRNKIVVVGIAKRLEEIYFPEDSIPLYINKKSESLKLIQQLRNEAHRFAINFHRDQRSKNALGTSLTDIPGVGEKISNKLLIEFKSIKRIKKLTEAQLEAFVGKSVAHKIYTHLHDNA